MTYDVAFKVTADEHFSAGQIVTIKPAGSVWSEGELTGLTKVQIDLTEAEYLDVTQNFTERRVDDVDNPTSIVAV